MAQANIQKRIGKQAGRKLARRSAVWEHFNLVIDEHGNETDIVQCKRCQSQLIARYGTTSLKKHVERCIGEEEAASPLPPVRTSASSAAVGASSVNRPLVEASSRDLARMIVFGGYDASVVEDDWFRSFVRRLNPDFKLPSRDAVEDMCDTIFDEAREDFFSKLRGTEAGLSFSAGTAETIIKGQIVYLACHFIDDEWNLHRMVTDAYMIVPDRDNAYGPLLGVREILFDVAGPNIYEFAVIYLFLRAHEQYEDYFSFSMVTKCIKEAARHLPLTITKFRCTNCMDNVFHSIAQCFSSYRGFDVVNDVYDEVESLCLTRQNGEKLLSDRGLEHPKAYDKEWYTCYCLWEVLRDDTTASAGFRQVLSIWRAIYRAIQSISATSRGPTSNLYLVELFKIRHVLDSKLLAAQSDLLDELEEAKETLDKALQDSYLLWSVPLVLDPRYKLKYVESAFRKAFGSEAANYVSQVTQHIEELFGHYIENNSGHGREDDDSQQEAETELGRYLKHNRAPHKEDFDILKWWKEYGTNQYPTVARMARDALAIPTCSKLSSEQTARVKSILRGYSKKVISCDTY